MRVTTRVPSGNTVIQEETELKSGEYNEYYLPALMDMGRSSEMWIIVEAEGVETKIHLKR